MLDKKKKKKYTDEDILTTFNTDDNLKLEILDSGVFEEGENEYADMLLKGELSEKSEVSCP